MHKENGTFIIIIGILVSLGRILLKDATEDNILIIMAIINYVAFGFVYLFLHVKLIDKCKKQINNSGIDTIKKTLRKAVLSIFSFLSLLIYMVFGILYISKYKSDFANDAISIFALSLSIATDNLLEGYGYLYCKVIIKISNYFEGLKNDNRKLKKKISRGKLSELDALIISKGLSYEDVKNILSK